MKKGLFLFVLFCTSLTYGQRRAANWFFGNNAGLNFTTGIPVPLTDGQINTVEGCTSISDKDTGLLLFYSDGRTIWNRNHEIMINGDELMGSRSSTQAALIVPLPESDNIYYVFTSDDALQYEDDGSSNGFHFSIVDMARAGGLGEVTLKNSQLLSRTSEKLTAVNAANGEDYWVITHSGNTFYAYEITPMGLNTTPITSSIGPSFTDAREIRGAIKASPDGGRIAIAHCIIGPPASNLGGQAYLYDFDNETGRVSNQTTLGLDKVYYGAEFSPNSTKLYMSSKRIGPQATTDSFVVEQFDMEAASIPSSKVVIFEADDGIVQSDLAGTLQVAMDGKIYHSFSKSQLSVIRTPNLAGFDADYRQETVNLGLRSSSFGLPPFIQSFFESIVTIEDLCFTDTTRFIVDPLAGVIAASWNFGDPASGAANTSTSISTSHEFTQPGLYTVTVDFEFAQRAPKRFIEFVLISPILDLEEGVVLTQCDIDGLDDGRTLFNLNESISLLYNNTTPGVEITANFFRTMFDAENNVNRIEPVGYNNVFNGQEVFARVFENSECFSIGKVILDVASNSRAEDIVLAICDTDSDPLSTTLQSTDIEAGLQATYPNTNITFYSSGEDALLEQNEKPQEIIFGPFVLPELYYRVETDANDCVVIGHVFFDIKPPPEVENQNVFFCAVDGEVRLSYPGSFNSYLWSTGEVTPEIVVTEAGNYELTVSNGEGCTDSLVFFVTESAPIEMTVTVTDFQQSNSIQISAFSEGVELLYSIDGGSTFQDTAVFRDLPPGYYVVVVQDKEGCSQATETILVRGVPRYFTPNNDGIHDRWHVDQARNYADLNLRIFDRYGKLLSIQNSVTLGWDGTYNGKEMPTGAYWYSIDIANMTYSGHFMLIRR